MTNFYSKCLFIVLRYSKVVMISAIDARNMGTENSAHDVDVSSKLAAAV
jgi:hypothetical protein